MTFNRTFTCSDKAQAAALLQYPISAALNGWIGDDTFIRVASYPLGFKPQWAHGVDLRMLHVYAVQPILEKEPLVLEDSRLWC